MQDLDLKQMLTMTKIIAEEKNLPEEEVLDIVQAAIAAAWRRDHGDRTMNVRAELDLQAGTATVFVMRTVVEDDAEDFRPNTQIILSIAQEIDPAKQVGDIIEESHNVTSFGRIASMTAKQVIVQKLREAERGAVFAAFTDRVGTTINGTISRVESKLVRIDLGKATGIMPKSEQIEGEKYTPGARIKVFIKEIKSNERGPQLILSRGCPEFVDYLFRQEVPELDVGTVEIRGIAREAGKRTKIAVAATMPGVDPVGTFVGGRGVRVQAVNAEIGDREKIDIISWSENASEYIMEALSPAEIVRVEIQDKHAKVYVAEDQQSIAIGRQGQNVRLASRLTGYELDIELVKPAEKKRKVSAEDSLLSALSSASEDDL